MFCGSGVGVGGSGVGVGGTGVGVSVAETAGSAADTETGVLVGVGVGAGAAGPQPVKSIAKTKSRESVHKEPKVFIVRVLISICSQSRLKDPKRVKRGVVYHSSHRSPTQNKCQIC